MRIEPARLCGLHGLMPTATPTPQDNYDRFIKQAIEQDQVFGLCDRDGGWAICPSSVDENIDVLVVWSDPAHASRHRREDWQNYVMKPIRLEAFINEWLKGMHEDGSLVGPNWDLNLEGLEVTPEDMARRLVETED